MLFQDIALDWLLDTQDCTKEEIKDAEDLVHTFMQSCAYAYTNASREGSIGYVQQKTSIACV